MAASRPRRPPPPLLAERRLSRRQQLDILRELAWSDFRLKYHDSVLGYLWSMLSPLLMFAIFYLVFHHVLGVRVPDYMPYLAVGLVYWTFFQDCTSSGITSLAGKAGLMKAVRVKPLLVLTAAALSTVITLVINTTLLVLGLGLTGRLTWRSPLALVPLCGLVLLATGVSFVAALAYSRFRDVAVVWPVLLQALFWLTPVTYRVTPQTPLWEILHLSPLTRCLSLLRWFLVYDVQASWRFLALSFAACAIVFAAGLLLVRRLQRMIPESL